MLPGRLARLDLPVRDRGGSGNRRLPGRVISSLSNGAATGDGRSGGRSVARDAEGSTSSALTDLAERTRFAIYTHFATDGTLPSREEFTRQLDITSEDYDAALYGRACRHAQRGREGR